MKHCLIVILILFTVALSAAESAPFSQPEIRAVWAMPWDIDSPQAIDNLIQTAVDNNQTELLLEVRYRADALYDTSRGEGDYPNPEPRYRMLKDANFDPLGYALEKAHAAKLQVQAWVIVFNATPTSSSLIQQNYIYQNHRDWITYDRLGRRMTSSSQFGYFIDPGIPEVQDYLLNVFGNLCTGYPELDGIHLDYIRYPEPDMGYHPISVERYKEYCRNHADITYNEWRIMQVSGFVGRLYRQTKQINPRMIVSAAVFADIADANVAYAQEWQSWLKNGIIDRIYPMAYNVRYSTHKSQVEQMKLLNRDKDIVIGLRAWDDKGKSIATNSGSRYTVQDVAKRIDLNRELGFGGTALFSYNGLKIGNAWAELKELSYNEPVVCAEPAELTAIDSPDVKPTGLTVEYICDTAIDIAPDFSISCREAMYQIQLQIPEAGQWCWEIHNPGLIYRNIAYYQKGTNLETWNGVLNISRDSTDNDVTYLAAGSYVVYLYKDKAEYQFLFPVQLEALPNP